MKKILLLLSAMSVIALAGGSKVAAPTTVASIPIDDTTPLENVYVLGGVSAVASANCCDKWYNLDGILGVGYTFNQYLAVEARVTSYNVLANAKVNYGPVYGIVGYDITNELLAYGGGVEYEGFFAEAIHIEDLHDVFTFGYRLGN